MRARPGVLAVVPDPDDGVAVVADTYLECDGAGCARAAASSMPGRMPRSTAPRCAQPIASASKRPFATPVDERRAARALARAKRAITHDYENPFLAHATMEPMNCVADVTASAARIGADAGPGARARTR